MFAVDKTEAGFRVTAIVTDDIVGGTVTNTAGETVAGTVTNSVFYVESPRRIAEDHLD